MNPADKVASLPFFESQIWRRANFLCFGNFDRESEIESCCARALATDAEEQCKTAAEAGALESDNVRCRLPDNAVDCTGAMGACYLQGSKRSASPSSGGGASQVVRPRFRPSPSRS